MCSFVIKIPILANKAVLGDVIRPALGLNIATVLEFIVEADLKKISVLFIFFRLVFHIFFQYSMSI